MNKTGTKAEPKFPLDVYRAFIRDAAAYVSLVVGRKISPAEADVMSEEELKRIAVLIDSRVDDLHRSRN